MYENNQGKKINIFKVEKDNFAKANPFSSSSTPFEKPEVSNPIKRINDYDSAMLNKINSNPKDGIDYRLKEKEMLLQDLDSKIEIADSYGTQNEGLSLRAKKQRLMQEIEALKKQKKYGGRILGSGSNNSFNSKLPLFQSIIRFFSKTILTKMSPSANSMVVLGESLEQLSQINDSIDELLDMNVPYGEKFKNYNELTKYLNKANVIHARITKSMSEKLL